MPRRPRAVIIVALPLSSPQSDETQTIRRTRVHKNIQQATAGSPSTPSRQASTIQYRSLYILVARHGNSGWSDPRTLSSYRSIYRAREPRWSSWKRRSCGHITSGGNNRRKAASSDRTPQRSWDAFSNPFTAAITADGRKVSNKAGGIEMEIYTRRQADIVADELVSEKPQTTSSASETSKHTLLGGSSERHGCRLVGHPILLWVCVRTRKKCQL